MTFILSIVYALIAAISLWGFFLMYCAIMASRRSGKFYLAPWPVRLLSYMLLAVLVVADVAFNLTVGTLLFAELPNLYRPTFTQRCSTHLDDTDWRGRLSTWICTGWLSPFEASHCR